MRDEQANSLPSSLNPLPLIAVLTACGGNAEGLRMMCQDFQTYALRLPKLATPCREAGRRACVRPLTSSVRCYSRFPQLPVTWPRTLKILRLKVGSKKLSL